MKLLENLSVLLVIPDVTSKTKLREVLRNVLYKCDVHNERSLKDLDRKLAEPISTKYQLLFVSGKYSSTELSDFTKSMVSKLKDKCPAIIVLLASATSKDSRTVASLYLDGVAGFISEPYTSDDVAELLTKIMEQRSKNLTVESETKSRKASNFLMADAMTLLDEVSRLVSEGKAGGYPLRDLRELSESFAEYYERDPQGYAMALVETFQKASPPAWAKGTSRKKTKLKAIKHPGVIVWELMAERNLSEERVAGLLRVDIQTVSSLTRGNISVDENLALGLSRVFGMSAREWLRMQTAFDDYRAESAKLEKKGLL